MVQDRALPVTPHIPQDADLPGLAAVLDPEQVKSLASAVLRTPTVEITDCTIEYLRYKPRTNCVVSYALAWRDNSSKETGISYFYAKAFQPDDFGCAGAKADGGRRLDVPHFPAVSSLADLCVVLYFYPNDAGLEGLRLISEPKKIQRVLYDQVAHLPQSEWRISDRRLHLDLVRYKPEKRAVLRIHTRATHRTSGERRPLTVYLRTYADERGAQVHAMMEALHGQLHGQAGVTTPAPRGYLPDRQTLLMDGLAGVPLTDVLHGSDRRRALRATGAALARLHRAQDVPAPARSTAELLHEAESTVRFLTRLVPDAGVTLDRIQSGLRDSAGPAAACARDGFVHGDFHAGQVLIDDERTALLDFDRSYRGDVAADLGNFGAHLHLMEKQRRITDSAAAFSDFLGAYKEAAGLEPSPAQIAFWQTFGLLQLAVRPFRTLEPNWAETIRGTLADCLRTIS